jgi:hypothetical protein
MSNKKILYVLFFIFNLIIFRLLFQLNENLSLLWIILEIIFLYFENKIFVMNYVKKHTINDILFNLYVGSLIFYINYKIINLSFINVFITNIVLLLLSYLIFFNISNKYSNKINKYLNKNGLKYLIFTILFILISIEQHYSWMYIDDYYYATLSFLDNYKGNIGIHTNIIDIINFLIYHYFYWSGRVLSFFKLIILQRIGIVAFRIVLSLIMTFIFIFIYKIISKEEKTKEDILPLFIVSLFGLFEIQLMMTTVMWETAAVLYIFPILSFLIYIYLYNYKKESKINNLICIILLVNATWSQEQMAVIVLTYVIYFLIHNYKINKSISKRDILMLIVTIISFLLLYLAPGSYERIRLHSDNNIGGNYILHIYNILYNNFGPNTRLFSVCFFASSTFLIFQNKKENNNIFNNFAFYLSIIILFFTCMTQAGFFISIYNLFKSDLITKIAIILLLLLFIIIYYSVFHYFYKRKKYNYIILIICSFLSQAMMIFFMVFRLRCVIYFEFFMFFIIAYVFYTIYLKLKNKKNIYYFIIPFCVICFYNYFNITYSYYENNNPYVYNDKLLKNTSLEIKNGKEISDVNLKQIKNYTSIITDPKEFENLQNAIKRYYDIPENIVFHYSINDSN